MPLGDLEVSVVMPRSDCHYSSAKLHVDRIIFDDCCCNRAVDPFCFKSITVLVLFVALIIWVHDDIFVTKLCFWTRSSYLKRAILERIECCVFLNMLHLVIRHICFKIWVPVYNAVTPVNEPRVIHSFKGLIDTSIECVIKRITQSRPVSAEAHKTHLI